MNFARKIRGLSSFHGVAQLVEDIPQLKRGMVWCVTCGRSEIVSSRECFANGWPKCCDQTMTIDSPEERAALTRRLELNG